MAGGDGRDKEEDLMEPGQGGIDNSKSVRDMHHLRLMSLLQEQVRDHGRRRAAEILGVDGNWAYRVYLHNVDKVRLRSIEPLISRRLDY